MIKQGAEGEVVRGLQTQLNSLGLGVEVDGVFGPGTVRAVQELQELFGYDVDGIVGPGTAALIDAQIAHGWSAKQPDGVKNALVAQGKKTPKGQLAGPELKRTLRTGVAGADVGYLQRRLAVLGLKVPRTGEFDDSTHKAVRTLQSKFGYDVDGIVGAATHSLINVQIGYGWNVSKGDEHTVPTKLADKQGPAGSKSGSKAKPQPHK